jgi:hypothetical protein
MKSKKAVDCLLLATLLLCLSFITVLGQTTGAAILGVVKDPTDARMPGAAVTVTNIATGVMRMMLTNETGAFNVVSLQPGSYDLRVEMPGFAVSTKKGIALTVGAEAVIDFTLDVEGVSQSVEVTAQAAQVDLATATMSHAVEGATIRELPLNGRDWTQLATLQPGVASLGGSGGGGKGGNGMKLTVSGARPSENNFRLDGISLNDNSNSTPGSILGTNLGVEAVREFSVISNSYSAEYGRATGGVINAVTKSGTNEIHGGLFYFHRNSALDARDFFDRGTKPSFRRHQFGAAIGGPIVKNRTFWFANYEGLHEFLATTSIANTLSENARNGILSTGTVRVDPQIVRLFPMLPLPNGPLLGTGDTGQYLSERDSLSHGEYVLGKMDHKFSDAGSLSGSYFFDDASSSAPDAFRTKRTADKSRRQAVVIEYTRIISPTLVNTTRFGFSRSAVPGSQITEVYNNLLEDPSLGFIPGKNIGTITVPGLNVPGGGPGATSATSLFFNSFQLHENVYISKGTHSLKIGASVERMQYNTDSPNRNGGEFAFGSLSDFLVNRPSTFSALYPGSDTIRGLRQTLLAGYVQDDMRVWSNFSLNVGLRYEFVTIPTEVNDKIALLHSPTDAQVKVAGPIHDRNPSLRNFAPRVGFAWDPFKTGKTSIRSSFGIFDSLPLLWLYDTPLTRTTPFFVQGSSLNIPVGSFPAQAFPLLQADGLRTAYIEVNPPRAYSMKWNLDIQRDIKGWIAEIGYTGSRGVHLPLVERNMNTVVPEKTATGYVYPVNGQVLNPNWGSINTSDTWNADSYYHGMQTSIKRSWSQGIQIQGSYAWSKSIDTASSAGSTNAVTTYAGAVALPTPLIPSINRGLSDFDIRHNFTLNMIWELPLGKGMTGPARWLVSGWQVGSIYRARTGLPFSASLNNDRAGSKADTNGAAIGQRPDLVLSADCTTLTNPRNPNTYIKTQCFTFPAVNTLGNLGRNTLTGPGVSNLDFSLFKNFTINETVNSQFRVEMFNALNHANFATPNIVLFDRQGRLTANAGQITSTSTESRRIQVGLKVNF